MAWDLPWSFPFFVPLSNCVRPATPNMFKYIGRSALYLKTRTECNDSPYALLTRIKSSFSPLAQAPIPYLTNVLYLVRFCLAFGGHAAPELREPSSNFSVVSITPVYHYISVRCTQRVYWEFFSVFGHVMPKMPNDYLRNSRIRTKQRLRHRRMCSCMCFFVAVMPPVTVDTTRTKCHALGWIITAAPLPTERRDSTVLYLSRATDVHSKNEKCSLIAG